VIDGGAVRSDATTARLFVVVFGRGNLVDERGFEPPASSLRTVGKIS
jgi:hypothetical protein